MLAIEELYVEIQRRPTSTSQYNEGHYGTLCYREAAVQL